MSRVSLVLVSLLWALLAPAVPQIVPVSADQLHGVHDHATSLTAPPRQHATKLPAPSGHDRGALPPPSIVPPARVCSGLVQSDRRARTPSAGPPRSTAGPRAPPRA